MVNIRLDQFEGPLDLLLHLIHDAKIDIQDIFISNITDQYLEAVAQAQSMDMDTASEFLAMAATLIEIKSRAMLPKPPVLEPDEESPEDELIRRLIEYKAYKDASLKLSVFQNDARGNLTRLPEELVEPDAVLDMKDLTAQALFDAFQRMLIRIQNQSAASIGTREIRREQFSVTECMMRIQSAIKLKGRVRFEELFSDEPVKEEVVSVFIALLELIKLEKLVVEQDKTFGEIVLAKRR
ncbi:MAG: segregation/condensation protein A [Clostridia bacterium]|nr:segregation/condensation protein A [Clostridia bacterium]